MNKLAFLLRLDGDRCESGAVSPFGEEIRRTEGLVERTENLCTTLRERYLDLSQFDFTDRRYWGDPIIDVTEYLEKILPG